MLRKLFTYIVPLISSVIVFTGCSDDDLTDRTDTKCDNVLLLRLSLDAPSGYTRAGDPVTDNPAGGEYGDGLRVGLHNENNIYDIYLYKYSSPDGINASDDTPATLFVYQKGVNFRPTASDVDANGVIHKDMEFNVGAYRYESANHDHFIAAINTEAFGQTTTLGRLRDEQIAYTCRPTGTWMNDYDFFTMSNSADSRFTGGLGTADDPFIVEIDVERTTARIDFAYSTSAMSAGNFRIDGNKYIYKVLGTSGDEIHLTHVRATNVMHAAPYLIKRLATDRAATPAYLADETNPASKYVIEPTTWEKTIIAAENNELNFNYWYRDSWYMTAHDTYNSVADSWFREKDRVHCGGTTGEHHAFTDGTTIDEVDYDWQYYVLDYANENTMEAEQTLHHYTTGLILKATYVPETVFTVDGSGNLIEDGSYAKGSTFWRLHDIDTNADLFFTSQSAAEAYQVSYPHSVVFAYENAQCYYNVWLRHENIIDDPKTTMMEFGIVRNNIYRVCVEFSGIGMPDVPDDMTTPETIRMFIYVRKWNLIQHPTIEI